MVGVSLKYLGSDAFSHRAGRRLVGVVCFLGALAILGAALRPTPSMSLERHWTVFGTFAACAAILMVSASSLVGRPLRLVAGVSSVLVLGVAALAHPVCVLLPEAEVPAFETVKPLSVRAAQGEPFCRLQGQWYQCKSVISRAFFSRVNSAYDTRSSGPS